MRLLSVLQCCSGRMGCYSFFLKEYKQPLSQLPRHNTLSASWAFTLLRMHCSKKRTASFPKMTLCMQMCTNAYIFTLWKCLCEPFQGESFKKLLWHITALVSLKCYHGDKMNKEQLCNFTLYFISMQHLYEDIGQNFMATSSETDLCLLFILAWSAF